MQSLTPDRGILDKRSEYRDLAQVALEAADTEILTQTFAEVVLLDSDAEILTQTWHSLFPIKKTPKLFGVPCRDNWYCIIFWGGVDK